MRLDYSEMRMFIESSRSKETDSFEIIGTLQINPWRDSNYVQFYPGCEGSCHIWLSVQFGFMFSQC